MVAITEAQAHLTLRRYHQTVYESAEDGYKEYLGSEHVGIHCPRTSATAINDHIWAQLVNRLDGVPRIAPVFDKARQLRFMKVDGAQPILLWLKKVTRERQHLIYPTEHATQILESGQCELFPRAQVLVLGYMVNQEQTGLFRVSVNPPCMLKAKPEWWIDIFGVPRMKLSAINDKKIHIKVHRSSQENFGL